MRYLIYVTLHHARKFGLLVLFLCPFYAYAQILVLCYAIGLLKSCVYKYPKNFPSNVFLPLLYTAEALGWVAAMYQGQMSAIWKYVFPLPFILYEENLRLLGLPVYAFSIGILDALARYRDQSDIHLVLEQIWMREYAYPWIPSFMRDIPWNFSILCAESISAFFICILYAFIAFFNEPRHVDDELRDATRSNDYEHVKRCLHRGADPNNLGSDGITSLHICAQQSIPRIAKLLLESGADPNSKDHLGMTPLHWAVQFRREEQSTEKRLQVIELILNAKADPHIPDNRNVTAHGIASKRENAFALQAINSTSGHRPL